MVATDKGFASEAYKRIRVMGVVEETRTKNTLGEYKVNGAASVPYTSFDLETGKTTVKSGKSDDGKSDSGDEAGTANNREGGKPALVSGDLSKKFSNNAQQVKPKIDVVNKDVQNDDKNSILFKPESERDKPTVSDGMKGVAFGGVVDLHNDRKVDPLHSHPTTEMDDLAAENYFTNVGSTRINNNGRYLNAYNRARDPDEQKDSFGQTAAQRASSATTTNALVNEMRNMSYAQWSSMTVDQRQTRLDAVDAQLAQTNNKIEADRAEYLDLTKQSFQLRFGEVEGAKMADQAHKISQESNAEAMQRMGVTEADFKNMTPEQSNQLHALQDKIATEKAKALYPNDAEKQKEVAGAACEEHGYDKRIVDGAIKAEGLKNGTQENQTNQNDQGMGEGQAGAKQIQVTTDDSNYSANRRREEIADYKAGNTMNATASASTTTSIDSGFDTRLANDTVAAQNLNTATQTAQTTTITPTYNDASLAATSSTAPAMTVAAPQGAGYTSTFDANIPQATTVAFNAAATSNGAILPAQNLTLAQQAQIAQQAYQEALIREFQQMMAALQGTDPNKVQVVASNAAPNTVPPPTQVTTTNPNNQYNMG